MRFINTCLTVNSLQLDDVRHDAQITLQFHLKLFLYLLKPSFFIYIKV